MVGSAAIAGSTPTSANTPDSNAFIISTPLIKNYYQ
jgi:hypothetical protein